ncbi:MAG: GDSL-type esterase/lipase family protein [Sphingopyxis sp.]|uniref:SGNH/GDSL hydrolase family protein n=1 Tax=Sphingopyxis sp. TaxID=1908224 RepID=UPI002ABD01A5|nr:GDSL-type esterase/lipase family protein [Sphingopyxis sp.]MDZ3832976.1 GDSL-type esterase/lipase family protein [Sphingopyxis sp.]
MGTALASLLLFWLAGADGDAQSHPPSPLPVHVGGRTIETAEGGHRFGWPGVYIEGRFHGSSVRVRFDAPHDHVRLSIDGVESRLFEAPGPVDLDISGLTEGEHVIRLDKLTESQTGHSRFIAFETVGTPLSPQPRTRQIEFIGDSFSVGYGNLSNSPDCTGADVHALTDTSRAFGPLTAAALDADYRINAFSGFGMVRNYEGRVPGESLPRLYPRAIPGEPAPETADPHWSPQWIVINLGTNDFSTGVRPGEAWPDAAALKAAYRDRYAGFVQSLAARHPGAQFILMGADPFFADVERVVPMLPRPLSARVRTLRFSGLDLRGCHGHPSASDHRTLAAMLLKLVAPR